MAKPLGAYPTVNTGADSPNNITGSAVGGEKYALDVNVKAGSSLALDGVNRDYVKQTDPDAITEVYTYRLGGAAGTITEIVTVVYTTPAKSTLDYADIVVF